MSSIIPPKDGKYKVCNAASLASFIGEPIFLVATLVSIEQHGKALKLKGTNDEIFLAGVEPGSYDPQMMEGTVCLIEGHCETRNKIRVHNLSPFPPDATFDANVWNEMIPLFMQSETAKFLDVEDDEKVFHFGAANPGESGENIRLVPDDDAVGTKLPVLENVPNTSFSGGDISTGADQFDDEGLNPEF